MKTQTEKHWAIAQHLSVFTGLLIPAGGIIAPLLIWLMKRNESKYLNEQGKEVMNLLICEGIAGAVLVLLALPIYLMGDVSYDASLVSDFFSFVLPIILMVVTIPTVLISICLPMIAAVKCSNGEDYRYPFIVRLIK